VPGRQTFVLLHRWTGLAIAFFLVVASLTGILLAFEDELEVWLAPELQLAQPAPGQRSLKNQTNAPLQGLRGLRHSAKTFCMTSPVTARDSAK